MENISKRAKRPLLTGENVANFKPKANSFEVVVLISNILKKVNIDNFIKLRDSKK